MISLIHSCEMALSGSVREIRENEREENERRVLRNSTSGDFPVHQIARSNQDIGRPSTHDEFFIVGNGLDP